MNNTNTNTKTDTNNAEFWDSLQELRKLSQLVLVALEADNLDEVQKLANRSDRLLAIVKPEIDRRSHLGDTELSVILDGLKTMNDRIVVVLNEKRSETAIEIERTRNSRNQVQHYKSNHDREPELLDVQR